MKPAPVLPPAPLGASCPRWMLVEWSEVFRNGLRSRSKILLEVEQDEGPARAGERWLVLVSWNLKSADVRAALPAALRKEHVRPGPSAGRDRATVGELFQGMSSAGEAVWFVSLAKWGGAAIFIRKPADEPALKQILKFNRRGRMPRSWQLPRRRFYPDKLRQAYVEQWKATQNARANSK